MTTPDKSRVFSARVPLKIHLLQRSGGIAAEVLDLREDSEQGFLQLQVESGGTTAERTSLGLGSADRGHVFFDTDLGELFVWTGSSWQTGAVPFGPAGGDLGGTYPNPTVVGIQGVSVQAGTPNNGDAHLYNSFTGQWEHAPIVFGGGPPTGPAGGDLGGLYPDPAVTGLQSRPVSGAVPSVGDALVWDGVAWSPSSSGLVGSYNMVATAVDITAAAWDIVLVTTTAGKVTITLPLAASCPGKPVHIKKVSPDGNVLEVDGQGAELIDGQANYQITAQYVCQTVVSDGSNWWII